MKIIKYLFLLFLLSLVALSIFIATQKGIFTVERSIIINSPIAQVYSFTHDLQNWKDWNSIAVDDPMIEISQSNNVTGAGSFIMWSGKDGSGELKTISQKENDSIFQSMLFNGNSADAVIHFKDTLGNTKVTLRAEGKMSFKTKFINMFNGGDASLLGNIFEKSLANLDKRLDKEINSYGVNVLGTVRKLQAFYLSQTFTSKFSAVNKNRAIVFSKINTFCLENDIATLGKPFVIYHSYDTIKKLAKISICVPIKDAIFTTEGSEILSDTLKSFDAVKTTLKGDYSHISKALAKTKNYLKANNLQTDSKFSRIEIYTIGKNETNNPSRWITDIYFPKKIKPIYKPARIAPLNTTTQELEQIPIEEEKEMPSEF